jgi:hypothetical protein
MASLKTVSKYFPTLASLQPGIHYAESGFVAMLDGELIDSVVYDDDTYTITLVSNNADTEGFISVTSLDEELGTFDIYDNVVSFK